MTGEKKTKGGGGKMPMLSLFDKRILRTLIVVLAGPCQVRVQQELDLFIKTISSIAICPVSIECVTRNLNLFKIVAPGGSCYLWASLMARTHRWELWGESELKACSIHPYFHAFNFLSLHSSIPPPLHPSWLPQGH